MAQPATKYCARCSMALTGPGACPRCGLIVGFGPGQTPPVDTPPAAAPPPPPPPPPPPSEPTTHADLPRIDAPYRSPVTPQPPPHPSPASAASASSAAPQRPQRDRSAFILPILGIACVLALIVGGLWFLTRDNDDPKATGTTEQADPSASPESQAPTPDDGGGAADKGPLKVDAGYENQGCTGDLIVVLASSGDPKSDDRTIGTAAKKVAGAKYLQTNKSCKTFNQSVGGNPIYAAYVGPFDSIADACQARIDTGVAASYVRTLSLDRKMREICSCHDNASDLPRLSTKTAGAPSYDIELRVVDLQSLLYLAGVNPSNIVTGTFGPQTRQMVRTFQRQQDLARDGWVGPQTWGRLLAQNCT